MKKMLQRRHIIMSLVGSLMLSGCSSQWVKTRSNAEDYTAATTRCTTQSRETFPVKNEVAQRTVYNTHYEKCGKKEDCDGDKWKSVKKPETESYVIDVNDGSRSDLFYQCMEEKGWENKTQWF